MRLAIARTSRRRVLTASAAAAVLVGLGGCAGGPATPGATTAPDVAVVQGPSLLPGTPVPAPQEAPLLTLTGRIGATNQGSQLQLDAGTLDRLGRVKVTVFDPWTKHDVQLQGIWLADVLNLAEADEAAQGIHLAALDDYEIDLPMADVRAGGILLATKSGDGSAIPIDEGGPTRIVFVGDVAAGSKPELWIWSVKSIDVR